MQDKLDASDLGWLLTMQAAEESSVSEAELVQELRQACFTPSCRRSGLEPTTDQARGASADPSAASNASTDYASSHSSCSSSPSTRPEVAERLQIPHLYPERRARGRVRSPQKAVSGKREEVSSVGCLRESSDRLGSHGYAAGEPAVN